MLEINWIFTQNLEVLLESSALILGLVNGLILLWTFLRERPILLIDPIHPETYQWFFALPSGQYHNQVTRRFGFLIYIGIRNKGLRDVALNSWHLKIKSINGRWSELDPLTIPEPQVTIGDNIKRYSVLGIKSPNYDGSTLIKSGDSIAGFSYYQFEWNGDPKWDPLIKEHKIKGQMVVTGVFDNKAKSEITMSEISLDKAKLVVPNIDTMYQDMVPIIDKM